MTSVSIAVALLAGIVAFASPCCLPLVPVYIGYMVGSDGAAGRDRLAALRQALVFVLGFTAVFVALWASVGAIGWVLRDYAWLLRDVFGAALIVMGLHVAGAIRISALYREVHLPVDRLVRSPARTVAAAVPGSGAAPVPGGGTALASGTDAVAGVDGGAGAGHTRQRGESTRAAGPGSGAGPSYGRSALLGVAFAAGWTPCVGPILGLIIGLASATESVARGTVLLIAYSLGQGIPFILIAVGATAIKRRLRWLTRHHVAVDVVTGALLILMGFLMITNLLARLSGLLPHFGI